MWHRSPLLSLLHLCWCSLCVVALPCREVERRRVSFQDAVSYHTSDIEPDVHSLSSERHVESIDSSTDALQRQKSYVVIGLAFEPETDALFFDASDSFEVDSDLDAVHDLSAVELAVAEVERLCSSESQQWEIHCSGAALSVLQSFSEMPLPDDADMVMHGQVVPEDAYDTEVAGRDRLVEIVQVSIRVSYV